MGSIMTGFKTFTSRQLLLVGFGAALIPLLVLLALQSVWLSRLEEASAIAHKASLANYLEAVGNEIQYFYRSSAERALNLPASLFTQGPREAAAWQWRKKPVPGARRLFLVDFTRERFGNYLVFNPECGTFEAPLASDETLAIVLACTPWQMLAPAGAMDVPALKVDERNPDHRIILNPITDPTIGVVGLAGMIVDEEYFKSEVLPAAVREAMPEFFKHASDGDLVVSVLDAGGNAVVGVASDAVEYEATRPLSFVFTDWTLALDSPQATPAQWAHRSFAFNMTLAALVGATLLGGVVLALRTADRAMKLSEMKSEFVSNISHELRTPLASIRVFAELLRTGKAQGAPKVQEYGEYIEAESRRLTRLINNILDFSKIESGRKTYRFLHADLREVVEPVIRSFEVRLKHAGFEIRVERSPEPLWADVDSDALGQAIHNLLDNAVKYSGESKEIRVRLGRDGDAVWVEVEDRGVGIPRDEQSRIFERFHRVSTGLVHDVKGAGLGLSIVQHVAEAHGGRVTVASEPGRGSTFTLRLPAAAAAAIAEPAGTPGRPETAAARSEG